MMRIPPHGPAARRRERNVERVKRNVSPPILRAAQYAANAVVAFAVPARVARAEPWSLTGPTGTAGDFVFDAIGLRGPQAKSEGMVGSCPILGKIRGGSKSPKSNRKRTGDHLELLRLRPARVGQTEKSEARVAPRHVFFRSARRSPAGIRRPRMRRRSSGEAAVRPRAAEGRFLKT